MRAGGGTLGRDTIFPHERMLRWLTLRRVLGWSHLLGGLNGYVGLVMLLASRDQRLARALPEAWYAGTVALFGLSLASGLTLLRRPEPRGRPLAALVEGLQLVGFHTGQFGYTFYSGLQLLLYVGGGSVHVMANVNSQFWLGGGRPNNGPFVAVDLLTLAAWIALWRASRQTRPVPFPPASEATTVAPAT